MRRLRWLPVALPGLGLLFAGVYCFAAEPAYSSGAARAAGPASSVQAAGSTQLRSTPFDAQRSQAVANQARLESVVAWRSGFVGALTPRMPLNGTTLSTSPPLVSGFGSTNLYSPYYFGPFEPTPFWPGFISGYPYVPRIEQPVGHSIEPLQGDIANGYVYQPVYAGELEPVPAATQVVSSIPSAPSINQRFSTQQEISSALPDDFDSPLSPAVSTFRNGEYRMVVAELMRSSEGIQQSAPAEVLRGYAQFALGNYAQASTAFHRALTRMPQKSWRAEALEPLGYYADRSRFDDQFARLTAYCELHPDEPHSRFVRAFLMGFRGDPQAAVSQLDHALRLGIEFDSNAPAPEEAGGDPLALQLRNYFAARVGAKPVQEPSRVPLAF